jgi:hypothetical protein
MGASKLAAIEKKDADPPSILVRLPIGVSRESRAIEPTTRIDFPSFIGLNIKQFISLYPIMNSVIYFINGILRVLLKLWQ